MEWGPIYNGNMEWGPIYNWDIEQGPMPDPVLTASHLVLTLLRFPTCLSAALPIQSAASAAPLGCARIVSASPTRAVLRAERVVGGAGRGPARGSRVRGRVDAVVQQVQRHPLARRGAELQQRVQGAHAAAEPDPHRLHGIGAVQAVQQVRKLLRQAVHVHARTQRRVVGRRLRGHHAVEEGEVEPRGAALHAELGSVGVDGGASEVGHDDRVGADQRGERLLRIEVEEALVLVGVVVKLNRRAAKTITTRVDRNRNENVLMLCRVCACTSWRTNAENMEMYCSTS